MNDFTLPGDVSLAFSNVPIGLSQMLTFPVAAHTGQNRGLCAAEKAGALDLRLLCVQHREPPHDTGQAPPAAVPERIVFGHVMTSRVQTGGQVVSSRADEYRRRAQLCLEMAALFRSPQTRVTLAHMAQAWLRLADNCEARPVVQQQQQIQPKKGDSWAIGTPADPIFAAFAHSIIWNCAAAAAR